MFPLFQLNWPRILLNRVAAILLGLAALLSAGAIIIRHSDINLRALSPLQLEAASIAGAASALGFFALLAGMGFFWIRSDSSSKRSRAIWLVLLIGGMGYGSHIAYYAIVYLPAVTRMIRNPEAEYPTVTPFRLDDVFRLFRPVGWALGAAWVLFILVIGSSFISPKIAFHESDPTYPFITGWMVFLIIGTPIYLVLLVFFVWKRWSKRSSPTNDSNRR